MACWQPIVVVRQSKLWEFTCTINRQPVLEPSQRHDQGTYTTVESLLAVLCNFYSLSKSTTTKVPLGLYSARLILLILHLILIVATIHPSIHRRQHHVSLLTLLTAVVVLAGNNKPKNAIESLTRPTRNSCTTTIDLGNSHRNSSGVKRKERKGKERCASNNGRKEVQSSMLILHRI